MSPPKEVSKYSSKYTKYVQTSGKYMAITVKTALVLPSFRIHLAGILKIYSVPLCEQCFSQSYITQVLKTLGLCFGTQNEVWCQVKMLNHGINNKLFSRTSMFLV